MDVTAAEPYGDDLYTEPDGDPDTLANLGPLAPMAGIWEGTGGADAAPGRRRDRAQHLRRALRAPAHRPPDQRAPALLRPPLPHPHREARRGGDLPRPGGLLAVGAGHQHRHPHPRHPPRPGAAGRRHRRAGRHRVRGPGRGRFRGLRHPVQPLPRPGLPDPQLPDARHGAPRRHLVLRGGGGAGHPRPRRALLPHRPQHPHPDRRRPRPTRWPRPPVADGSLGIGNLRNESRTLP